MDKDGKSNMMLQNVASATATQNPASCPLAPNEEEEEEEEESGLMSSRSRQEEEAAAEEERPDNLPAGDTAGVRSCRQTSLRLFVILIFRTLGKNAAGPDES